MCGIGVLAGLLMHHGLLIHGEWHVWAPRIFLYHLAVFICPLLSKIVFQGSAVGQLFNNLALIGYGYLPGLLSSIIIYRLFFHRLSKAGFPGPVYTRVSKLWHLWACRTAQNHLVLDALQAKYGDFVRTGETS